MDSDSRLSAARARLLKYVAELLHNYVEADLKDVEYKVGLSDVSAFVDVVVAEARLDALEQAEDTYDDGVRMHVFDHLTEAARAEVGRLREVAEKAVRDAE